jgi:hypothetical protein
VRAEAREVLEVRLRERGGVAHRLLGRERAVGLDRQREAVVVGALADARLGDREVRAAHRVVDRVHAHEVHGEPAVHRVLVALDVAAPLVDVELDVELAVLLEREQVVRGSTTRTPLASWMSPAVTGPASVLRMRSTAVSTSASSASVSVLSWPMIWWTSSTTPGIVWCSCTTPSMRKPHTAGAAQRRQQEAAHGVAERVAEAALERLQPELGDVRVVVALRRLDELRAHEPAEIDGSHECA